MNLEIKAERFSPAIMFHYRSVLYDVADHTHDFLMVYYVVSGSAKIRVDGSEYTVRQGDLVLIDPGRMHGHVKSDSTLFYLGVSNFQIEGNEKNHLGVQGNPVITPLRYPNEIYNCYRQIIETLEKKDACWDLLSNVYSAEFFVWIVKELSPSKSDEMKEFFQLKMYDKESIVTMMTNYLKDNYMKKISVEEIARSTYLSTTYVTKIFKEIINDTPINYLIQIRLEKAKELLREGKISIQDISKQIGYDDPYYFSKLFKKKYGMAPSEYRKQQKAIS